MIDHSRAFRWRKELRQPQNLTRVDRVLLDRLRALELPSLEQELKGYLGRYEIEALLVRRDLIVRHFEEKGVAVLYDARRLQ
jgi:hypothetical protein